MYTKEQIEIALKEYERLGSVQAVMNLLEYPSSSTLYRWYERKLAEKTNYHGSLDKPYIKSLMRLIILVFLSVAFLLAKV